ncbi:hypothetical protein ACQ4PT_043830 [Festuca glaucescens]
MASAASAQLSSTFYDTSCPDALSTIRRVVTAAVRSEPRMGASLVRLHFHDCFVDGCDGSVLLADTGSFVGEQGAAPNAGSIRGMNVIDNAKTQVEAVCKQTVSCADILAVAARDSVFAAPTRSGSRSARTSGTGSTTIPTSTRPSRRRLRQTARNRPTGSGDSSLAPLDKTSPNAFDNANYSNLLSQKGLLHSDQVLFNGGSTDNTVRSFASNPSAFGSAFATAMVKMGNIAPKTGTQGQIRLSCSKVNA